MTSHYFSNYDSRPEQRLIEDLIVESIKIMGFSAYYLPNNNSQSRDLIYGEDPVKFFTSAFPIDMYLSNATEYGGEKEFFSKFGLEIKNNITVMLSKREFAKKVPQNTFTRPREGDLVYVPVLNGVGELYEIKFTNINKDMSMLGRKVPYFYELEMEKFHYSQEVISTGVADIDGVVTDSAYTITLNTGTGSGTYTLKELVYQSPDNTYANASTIATLQTWIPSSNTMTVTNIAGVFVDGQNIIGVSSGASYMLGNYNTMFNPSNKEVYDNITTTTQAGLVINVAENNPIGGL